MLRFRKSGTEAKRLPLCLIYLYIITESTKRHFTKEGRKEATKAMQFRRGQVRRGVGQSTVVEEGDNDEKRRGSNELGRRTRRSERRR